MGSSVAGLALGISLGKVFLFNVNDRSIRSFEQ